MRRGRMPGMTSATDERRAPPAVGPVLAIILSALLLYVLSVGPVVVICANTHLLDLDTFRVIYSPLIWLGRQSETLGDLLYGYGLRWH